MIGYQFLIEVELLKDLELKNSYEILGKAISGLIDNKDLNDKL